MREGGAVMLRQLKYFQSVVRRNSFSAAAEENFISQSAISQQIQALERELGFPLLERRNRSFALTPAGKYFSERRPLDGCRRTLCPDAGGKVFLSEEPDPDGGL